MEVGLQGGGFVANGAAAPAGGILAVGEVQRTTNRYTGGAGNNGRVCHMVPIVAGRRPRAACT